MLLLLCCVGVCTLVCLLGIGVGLRFWLGLFGFVCCFVGVLLWASLFVVPFGLWWFSSACFVFVVLLLALLLCLWFFVVYVVYFPLLVVFGM